jgi:Fe-S cluster assembly ATPase SufC
MADGRIVAEGGPEMAGQLEETGYEEILANAAI